MVNIPVLNKRISNNQAIKTLLLSAEPKKRAPSGAALALGSSLAYAVEARKNNSPLNASPA
jgi:hypothetical protein